jgi:hypothetical protein
MRKTLAYESNVDVNGSNDIYDLYLVDIGNDEVQLIVYMKILFTFVPGKNADGTAVTSTDAESSAFVAKWRSDVATAWTARH